MSPRETPELTAEEKAASEREAELVARERAWHGKERALDERRRGLAEREASLRARAVELAEKAPAVGVTVHEEVRAAGRAQVLEAPLAEFARAERRRALDARREAQRCRAEALDAAEVAAAGVEASLREADAELGHRENSVAALAREVIRRERAELEHRESRAREMAAASRREADERAARARQAEIGQRPAPAAPAAPARQEAVGEPPSESGSNRRRGLRLNVELDVTLASEHNFFSGFTQNISEGGLFIATHDYVDVGSEMDIKLHVAGREIRSRGRVAWLRDYNESAPDTSPGMGVEFIGLTPADAAAIEAFLRKREPMFYDI